MWTMTESGTNIHTEMLSYILYKAATMEDDVTFKQLW